MAYRNNTPWVLVAVGAAAVVAVAAVALLVFGLVDIIMKALS